ncbi:hypothetical protein DVH24_010974 [Malus domestica]|uniref:Uncharacterized protein n=1 Tax=Malus domestica TaxID=3750 RepID=A0A498JRT2_MALDO|nr:hypothetical protein DVH24_010974 [Malus domestica]
MLRRIRIACLLGVQINLRHLYLEGNSFWGSIPTSIGNLSSLKTLNLQRQRYERIYSRKFWGNFLRVDLGLSKNSWEDNLTETHLINLTRLKCIDLSIDQDVA